MRKRLLLAALALVSVASTYAFEVGEYVYTASQRLKVIGENLVVNGDFAEDINTVGGWTSTAADGIVSAGTWLTVPGAGPNGESVLESQGATEGESLCNVWYGLYGGETYVVSFQIKGGAAGATTVGTTVGSNYADFFQNTDGSFVQVASTDEAPVTEIAAAYNFTENWSTVNFVFTAEEGQPLVMHFEKFATGTQITNIALHQVLDVYDDRLLQAKLAFADAILGEDAFNTEEAQGAREEFVSGVYDWVKSLLGTEGLDDKSTVEGYVEAFDEGLSAYMDVAARRMNDYLAGTSDISSLATVGRGANRPATYANLDLWSGNWGHQGGLDYLQSSIQQGYAHSATYNVFNNDFPAGKYFFSAEIRNANTGKDSWPTTPTFNLATVCKIFIGTDSLETDTVAGEAFQKFYIIADIDEAGKFRAGVEWPGVSSGGSFFVREVEVRAFGDAQTIVSQIDHIQAFKTYTTQYNAAVSAYENVRTKVDNPNYPWDQQVLLDAKAKYDPIFNAHRAKGWIDANGNDTGVASTDELNDWALYQDVEEYDETTDAETGEVTQKRKEYQVVRGYQAASNTVIATNQVITDLAEAIDEAKATRNLSANQTGDRDTYKAAILEAINTITTIRANTTDATRVADSTALRAAQDKLAQATAAFLATVQLAPFADIDFSKGVSYDEDKALYYVEGTVGSIQLSNYSAPFDEAGTAVYDTNFTLGRAEGTEVAYPDVLRIGNGTATVDVPAESIPTDASTFRAIFDIWFGNLTGRNIYVDLRNAAGQRIAGFSLNRYGGTVAYNEFNNDANEGMDLLGYATGIGSSSASNTAILVDNNRTSFDLTIDYAANTLKGVIKNPQKGTKEGIELPLPTIDDNKVAHFVVGSNYSNADRRGWFDNLKLYSFVVEGGSIEEDITESPWAEVSGINSVSAGKTAQQGIYSLQGVKLNQQPQKGFYIMNGKKYVVK